MSKLRHPSSNLHSCPNARARGFSLIEVLVSIIIFAFALLGVAGLQINSLRSSQNSGYSAIASNLARDYNEYVLGSASVSSSNTSTVGVYEIDTSTYTSVNAAGACVGTSKNCTPTQLLQDQQKGWVNKVKNELPNGKAVICRDNSSIRDANGYFSWGCTTSGSGDLLIMKLGWESKSNTKQGEVALDFGVAKPRLVVILQGNQQ
jgi:type IV pilus assembly protein PilV